MSEEKFREWISSEFEKEAEELEKRLQEHEAADPELAALEMPEDSFDDLMRRIKAEKRIRTTVKMRTVPRKSRSGFGSARSSPWPLPRSWWLQWVQALPARNYSCRRWKTGVRMGILIQRLLMERWKKTGTFQRKMPIRKLRTDWGFRQLRLNDKPQDMVLEKVYIDDVMGEAQMEFSV